MFNKVEGNTPAAFTDEWGSRVHEFHRYKTVVSSYGGVVNVPVP